jgi:hypothetical protein
MQKMLVLEKSLIIQDIQSPGIIQHLTEMSAKFLVIRSRSVCEAATSTPSLSRLSRTCGILNISPLYRH